MRAHGTQKLRQKPCAHTKNTSTWPANKSPAMCKTGHEHAANEKTHKPRSHKTWQHESTQPMKYTSCVPHSTRHNMTARTNTNCVQHNKTHVDRRACGRANSRPHTPTKRQNMERKCPNPDTNRNSRHECWDPNTTLQHQTRYANERAYASSTLEAARSHENRTWREYQGSVTKPWITLDRSDRTLTTLYSVGLVTQKKLYITHY